MTNVNKVLSITFQPPTVNQSAKITNSTTQTHHNASSSVMRVTSIILKSRPVRLFVQVVSIMITLVKNVKISAL